MSTVDFSGARWRKSSASSGGDHEECVEVAYLDFSGAQWRKSSTSSGDDHADCVEVAYLDFSGAQWRKSSTSSGGDHEDCVEVAQLDAVTGVRDSKNAAGPILTFPFRSWFGFLQGHGAPGLRD